jgi:carotenoid cleavage dioxygenase-like enzyme
MAALASPGGTLMQALRWEPQRQTRLLVVARAGGQPVALVPLDQGYCLHTINAFERADGCLVVDFVELERPVYDQYEVLPELLTDVPPGRPVRVVVDLARQALVSRQAYGQTAAPDFPAIDPRLAGQAHDDVWLLDVSHAGQPGRKFFDTLVHTRASQPDWCVSWRAPAGYLGGEPLFVPGAGPRQGALLCPLFDAATRGSSLLIFDAFELAAGPCARVHLAAPIQLGFHAAFMAANGSAASRAALR